MPTAPSSRDALRRLLTDGLGRLDSGDEARLRRGDPHYAARRLEALEEDRTWVVAVSSLMALMAVILPTAGLYQFFRVVNSLQPIELIGVIAAACLVAALQMTAAVVLYMDWNRRRLCYRALAALPDPSAEAADAASEPADSA